MAYDLTLKNRFSELEPTLDRLEALLEIHGWPAPLRGEMRLLLEEALVNILTYAFEEGREQEIGVSLTCDPGAVHLLIEDSGRPFNPLEAPAPDLSAPADVRSQGGAGIHLIRSLSCECSYRRQGGRNQLRLTKRRSEGRPDPSGNG